MALVIILGTMLLSAIDVSADTITKSAKANVCGYTVTLSTNYQMQTYKKAEYVRLTKVLCKVNKNKGKKQTGSIKNIVIHYGQGGPYIIQNSKGKWEKKPAFTNSSSFTMNNPKSGSEKSKAPGYKAYVFNCADLSACGAYATITYTEGKKTLTKTIKAYYVN